MCIRDRNKQVVVLRMAVRARKVIGTFEKRAPGLQMDMITEEQGPTTEMLGEQEPEGT